MKVLVIIAVTAVALSLLAGLYTLTRGGEAMRRRSNRLMQLRVGLQGLAVALLFIAFFVAQR